jgi:hypothetical protein
MKRGDGLNDRQLDTVLPETACKAHATQYEEKLQSWRYKFVRRPKAAMHTRFRNPSNRTNLILVLTRQIVNSRELVVDDRMWI